MLRTHRLLAAIALTTLSCAPTGYGPNGWEGRVSIDAYAEPGAVTLYWSTTTNPDCIDFPCPPPGPLIFRVTVEGSSSGGESGFAVLRSTPRDGPDSTTIGNLTDGRMYWYRVVAYDVQGRVLLKSAPVMVMPGPLDAPAASMPIFLTGRFDWSAGGDTLAFADADPPGPTRLRLLDATTLAITTLKTYQPDQWVSDAAWSRDGRSIAFTHTPSKTVAWLDYRIRTMSIADTHEVVCSPGRVDFDPSWSEDWLYFCRGSYDQANIPEVWRVRPGDPSSLERLTSDPSVYKYGAAVRPRDDEVAYYGRRRGWSFERSQLFIVRPGSSPFELLPNAWYGDSYPSWDPDGVHVTFVSNRSGHGEVWSVNRATGALTQVTRGRRGTNKQLAARSATGRLAVLDGVEGGLYFHGELQVFDPRHSRVAHR